MVQVAANAGHTIKLLPTLNINDADCTWIEGAFDSVVADAHRRPRCGLVARQTLAENVRKGSR